MKDDAGQQETTSNIVRPISSLPPNEDRIVAALESIACNLARIFEILDSPTPWPVELEHSE